MARGQRWIGLKRNRRAGNVFCAEGRSEETQDAVVTPHAVRSRHGMENREAIRTAAHITVPGGLGSTPDSVV